MIEHTLFPRMKVDQLHAFGEEVLRILENYSSEDSMYLTLKTALETNFLEYQKLVNKARTNVLTSELKSLDKLQDSTLRGFFKLVDAYMYSPDAQLSQKAGLIADVIDRYGRDLPRQARSEQSAKVPQMLTEINDNFASELAAMGATQWIQWIREEQNSIDTKTDERTSLEANIPTEAASDYKGKFIDSCEQIFNYMNLLATAMKQEQAQALCEQLNVIIVKYNAQVRNRLTRNENVELKN